MLKCAQVSEFGKPLEFVTRPIPDVPPKGALLKTLFAGICHSDIHLMDDEWDFGGGVKSRHRDTLGEKYCNLVLGHESVGRIEAFGSEVNAKDYDLSVGDEVIVYPWVGCGRESCEICAAGHSNNCDAISRVENGEIGLSAGVLGAYSTQQTVPDVKFLVKFASSIPKELACTLPCSAVTAYSALKKARPALELGTKIRGKSTLLLVGLGGLGLWAIKLAKILYPNVSIVGADISKDKFDLAESEGVERTVHLERNGQPKDMAVKITNNMSEKFDAAIDFVGASQTLVTIALSLHHQGTIINIGLFGGILAIPTLIMTIRSLTLIGNKVGTLQDLKEIIELIAKQSVKYPNIEIHSFDEINDLFSRMRAGKIQGRAVIKHD